MTDKKRIAVHKIRKRVFEIIQISKKDDMPSKIFDWFIAVVIVINILTIFLDSFDELAMYSGLFNACEIFTISVFAVEYLLRIWTADFLYPKFGKYRSRLKFLCSFEGIVDLLTMLPFFFLDGFVVFRMLRVVRIFHLFRVNARYDSLHVITSVIIEKKNQIISSLFIIIVLMLASSLGIYNVEHEVQPEVFKNAFSGIWWSVSTLLTVGYGDIYPVTAVGRIMAIFIAFLGVGVVAIPTGIISAGFVEQYTQKQYDDIQFKDVAHVGEVLVEKGSHFAGKTIGEAEEKYNIRIYMLIRDELSVIAYEKVKIKCGDILILKSEKIRKRNSEYCSPN